MKQYKVKQDPQDHLEEFQSYLDDVDIPDDQKRALLELIWSIMVEFVALGFGADATSQAIVAHLADGLAGTKVTDKSPQKLTDAFCAAQPNIEPKTNCEA